MRQLRRLERGAQPIVGRGIGGAAGKELYLCASLMRPLEARNRRLGGRSPRSKARLKRGRDKSYAAAGRDAHRHHPEGRSRRLRQRGGGVTLWRCR